MLFRGYQKTIYQNFNLVNIYLYFNFFENRFRDTDILLKVL